MFELTIFGSNTILNNYLSQKFRLLEVLLYVF